MVLPNPWAAAPLLAGTATLLAGLVVLLRRARAPAHSLFSVFCLLAGAGNVAFALSLLAGDEVGFLQWNKVGWVLYLVAAGVFCHFTFVFPRRRVALADAGHPWVRRIPRSLLDLDRRIVRNRALPWVLCYLPAAPAGVLVLLPDDTWLAAVHPAFFGYVTTVQPTLAALPALAAGALGFGFLGSNLLAGVLGFPEKRRITRFLLAFFLLGGVLLLLLFTLPRVSLQAYAVGIFGNYLGMAGFAAFLAVAVVRYGLLVNPVEEARDSRTPRFDLPRAAGYLVREEKPDLAFRVFSDLVTHGAQGLGLVRTSPSEVRETYAIPRTPLVWVGRLAPSPDIQAMDHPEGLLILVAKFLEECTDGVVVLDALEYLVQRHGSSTSLQTLYNLREIVARHSGRLIVLVNPSTLRPQELSLLEKELENLSERG